MKNNSNNVGIEMFDKNNYQQWKFKMRNYLIGKILWGYVTGEEVEPKLPTENVSAKELKAWKTWNETKRLCFSFHKMSQMV